MSDEIKVIRVSQACNRLGVSRPTLYRWMKKIESFPKPVLIGLNTRGFIESELNDWILSQRKSVA